MRQGLGLEVADDLLDLGVITMVDIRGQQRDLTVGDEAVVAPVGPERELLGVGQTGAAND